EPGGDAAALPGAADDVQRPRLLQQLLRGGRGRRAGEDPLTPAAVNRASCEQRSPESGLTPALSRKRERESFGGAGNRAGAGAAARDAVAAARDEAVVAARAPRAPPAPRAAPPPA